MSKSDLELLKESQTAIGNLFAQQCWLKPYLKVPRETLQPLSNVLYKLNARMKEIDKQEDK